MEMALMSSEGAEAFSEQEFRAALGQFATGVTVVTARADEEPHIGFTVNSFNSVSLSPPLILFSVARSMQRFDLFRSADAYVVNVLTTEQERISTQFAASDEDKWADVRWREGEGGAPVLLDALATFECVPWAEHDGGDHVIFVGEVKRFAARDDAGALGYFRGGYADVAPRK